MIIYKTTNLVNGKIYVGQDSKNDSKYLGSGINISRAIKKYGFINFKKEILEFCKNIDELNEREIYWISLLNSIDRNIGYNISIGGKGGQKGLTPWNKGVKGKQKAWNKGLTQVTNFGKRGENWNTSKKILQFSKDGLLIKEWNCSHDIKRELNLNRGNICRCCNGKRKTAEGYIWQYK